MNSMEHNYAQSRHDKTQPGSTERVGSGRARNRRHRVKKSGLLKISAEFAPETYTGHTQYYDSEQHPAAVIWRRENDTVPAEPANEKPLPTRVVAAPVLPPEVATQEMIASPPPERRDTVPAERDMRNTDRLTGPQRSYFWNESPSSRPVPTERDTLPAVPAESDARESEPLPLLPETPQLESAVNPNAPDDRSAIPEQLAPAPSAAANGRAAQPAVQSSRMESGVNLGSFDGENRPFTATNFPTSAEVAGPESLEVMPTEVATAETTRTPAIPDLPELTNSVALAAEASSVAAQEHSMDRAKLLELAGPISIDGVSVRDMFMVGRIDEVGLRRIVTELIRGGNVNEVVSRELLRQQMRFERDPQLRDTPINPGLARRTAGRVKRSAQSLLDPERGKDHGERFVELTQAGVDKMHELFQDTAHTERTLSIAAIVVLYLTILIVALLK